MEWVETTGKTIDEAKDRALDLLGVDERDAEFEVIEQPKIGFLGRVKSLARVRARVRPAAPRPKTERRDRRRRGDGPRNGRGKARESAPATATGAEPTAGEPTAAAVAAEQPDAGAMPGEDVADKAKGEATAAADAAATERPAGSSSRRRRRRRSGSRGGARSAAGEARGDAAADDSDSDEKDKVTKGTAMPELSLEEQGRLVASFMEGLVDAFGLEATTAWEKVDDESVEVRVEGSNLGLLVGPKGGTLQAVTEVARSIVVRQGEGSASGRVNIDVAGYRQRRRDALQRFTRDVAAQVVETGKARALEPMNPADRKVVHDTVNEIEGVVSTSEGDEPNRRVVISPV